MKLINKKIVAIIAFVLLLPFYSCDSDFEEINTDPNNSKQLPAHLILGFTQRVYMNVSYNVLGSGMDLGGVWAQHWTKVQYNDEERYNPRRGTLNGLWASTYTNVINESQKMIELAVIEDNTNLQAAGMIMKAVGFQYLTEMYGPIPFSEALDPTILKPKYDSETDVYQGIIDLYTNASTMLKSGTGVIEGTSDLFFAGDTSKWLKLANSLKFRALMRISKTRNVSSELQALVNEGMLMSSNNDSAQINYLAAAPDANPIFETIVQGNRAEYKVCSVLTEKLTALSDPRLEIYTAPNDSGVILGKPPGYGGATPLPNESLGYTYSNISPLGDFYLNPELPGVLLSHAELKFLMAEAANEEYITGGISQALIYFNEAIESNFNYNGLNASVASDYSSRTTVAFSTKEDGRTKIAEQKWIALYGQGFEAYTEWRRLKIPNLLPAFEGFVNEIPSRYFYPSDEQSLNVENYNSASSSLGGDELTSKLFWQ